MKVIIVEVTRAANSFGQTHLAKIREAYGRIADIVARAQARGRLPRRRHAEFAAMAFYGAIEQVLTGWIFGLLARARRTTSRPSASSSTRSATGSRRIRRSVALRLRRR